MVAKSISMMSRKSAVIHTMSNLKRDSAMISMISASDRAAATSGRPSRLISRKFRNPQVRRYSSMPVGVISVRNIRPIATPCSSSKGMCRDESFADNALSARNWRELRKSESDIRRSNRSFPAALQ